MNETITRCIEQSSTTEYFDGRGNVTSTHFDKEKFAQLVASECAAIVSLYRRDNMQDKAIADTLEHCYTEIKLAFGLKL